MGAERRGYEPGDASAFTMSSERSLLPAGSEVERGLARLQRTVGPIARATGFGLLLRHEVAPQPVPTILRTQPPDPCSTNGGRSSEHEPRSGG